MVVDLLVQTASVQPMGERTAEQLYLKSWIIASYDHTQLPSSPPLYPCSALHETVFCPRFGFANDSLAALYVLLDRF